MNKHTTNEPTNEIPYGYCHCGCGGKTAIRNRRPNKFIHNHHFHGMFRRATASPQELDEIFWSKVIKPGDCWLWTGTILGNGYGQFWNGRKNVLAHRFSYVLAYGQISDDLLICHRCDVRNCVRPDHLFAGTQKENIADMFNKQRQNRVQGEQHGLARFTNEQARELRKEFVALGISVQQFARIHNIPEETMRRLINRITYKDA